MAPERWVATEVQARVLLDGDMVTLRTGGPNCLHHQIQTARHQKSDVFRLCRRMGKMVEVTMKRRTGDRADVTLIRARLKFVGPRMTTGTGLEQRGT